MSHWMQGRWDDFQNSADPVQFMNELKAAAANEGEPTATDVDKFFDNLPSIVGSAVEVVKPELPENRFQSGGRNTNSNNNSSNEIVSKLRKSSSGHGRPMIKIVKVLQGQHPAYTVQLPNKVIAVPLKLTHYHQPPPQQQKKTIKS